MAKVTVTFRSIDINAQEYGGTDGHMVSRIFFDVDVEGGMSARLFANVTQAVGRQIEDANLQVSPVEFPGLSNEHFAAAARDYYHRCLDRSGQGIRITRARSVRLQNVQIVQDHTVVLDSTRPVWDS